MRYFIDTEFIEDGKTIDLISIGIVAEDGREYYAVNDKISYRKAGKWVLENVLAPMGISNSGWAGTPDHLSPGQRANWFAQKNRQTIKEEILEFCSPERYGKPEFWADYASYDWVVLCQLFGTMMDLPAGFPMYCNDIQQLRASLGYEDIEPPKQHGTAHNALEDARYVQELWDFYTYWTDENMSD